MPSLDLFHDAVDARIQDAAEKLDFDSKDSLIVQAIVQRYSKDRPIETVSDVASDGTALLAVPTGFVDGFSFVKQIEYPIGAVPPTYVEPNDWQLYRSPSALKIMLLALTVAAAVLLRVTWTKQHAADGSTVPDVDFAAVSDYAAALCCDALAASYTQAGDASLAADSVNYRTKGQEYLALSARLRARYFSHIGIEEKAGAGSVGPAIATGSMDEVMGWGGDRITHPRPR